MRSGSSRGALKSLPRLTKPRWSPFGLLYVLPKPLCTTLVSSRIRRKGTGSYMWVPPIKEVNTKQSLIVFVPTLIVRSLGL